MNRVIADPIAALGTALSTSARGILARACDILVGASASGILVSCSNPEPSRSTSLLIAGSDTEVNVVQRLAEQYRQDHPEIMLSVSGGGSGAGLAAMIEGRIHVANSSRVIQESELAAAKAAGIGFDYLMLATDALALIVHASNPIQRLTLQDAGRLFRGEIRNWKELGGPDLTVNLYGRQTNSGTYVYFRSAVVEDDYSLRMMNLNGNAQILEGVRADIAGVGYVGVGYVANSDAGDVAVVEIEHEGRTRNPLDLEAVLAGDYPITRPLYQYFRTTAPAELYRFLEYELSDVGAKAVQDDGFYPPPSAERRRALEILRKLGSEE